MILQKCDLDLQADLSLGQIIIKQNLLFHHSVVILAMHPPWRHWFNDVIPPYTRPPDRRTAREEREAERERLGQLQRDAAHQQRERDLADRRYEIISKMWLSS